MADLKLNFKINNSSNPIPLPQYHSILPKYNLNESKMQIQNIAEIGAKPKTPQIQIEAYSTPRIGENR